METQIEMPKDCTEEIVKLVYNYFNTDPEQKNSKCRKQEIILPKHISCFFLKKYNSSMGYEKMAKYFGMSNHTSVLFAVKKIEFLSKRDVFYVKQIENIEKIINETLFQKNSIYNNSHKKCSIAHFVGNKKVIFLGFEENEVFASVKKMQKDEVFKNITHHDSEYMVSVIESPSEEAAKPQIIAPNF